MGLAWGDQGFHAPHQHAVELTEDDNNNKAGKGEVVIPTLPYPTLLTLPCPTLLPRAYPALPCPTLLPIAYPTLPYPTYHSIPFLTLPYFL